MLPFYRWRKLNSPSQVDPHNVLQSNIKLVIERSLEFGSPSSQQHAFLFRLQCKENDIIAMYIKILQI